MHKIYSALIGCLLASLFTAAQKPVCRLQLKGKIHDAHSSKALDFAALHIVETKQETLADEYGKFTFRNLCVGKYTLHISHVGCEPELYEVYITKDTVLALTMHHTEAALDEVVIEQHRNDQQVTVSTTKLQSKNLEKLRGLSLGETLKNIPGVASLNTGSNISKPIVHGLQGVRVLLLNNGIRQEAQQWGNEHAPEIDPFMAQKITIIKGANTVRYGSDAIGGVILLEPNSLPNQAAINGELHYVLQSNNAEQSISGTIEGNHQKISALAWRVQGTYRRGGNAKTARYWLSNTGVEEGNFSTTVGWNKKQYGIEIFYSRFQTDIGILSSSHFGNLTDLQRAIANGNPTDSATFSFRIGVPRQHVVHNLLKATARINTSELGELKILFAYQHNLRREFDKHRAYNSNATLETKPGAELGIQTITTDVVWEHKRIKQFAGMLGINFATQTNNQKYSNIIPPFWNFNGGIFWIERWQYRQLEIEAGLRFDYRWQQAYLPKEQPSFNYAVPSGSIGAEYHFTEKIKWNVQIASAWRAPNMVELFAAGVHHGAASYDKGNRKLTPEISINMASAFELSSAWINLHAAFYQNFIQQFIYIKPSLQTIETIRGTFPVFEYTQANVSLTGGDIDLEIKPFKGFQINSKISLLRAWNRSAHEGLIWMPPQRFENGLRYSFSPSKKIANLYIGTSVLYVMKQLLAPPNQDFAPPPPAYWLLNAEAGFEINTRMPQPIAIHLAATNLLNTSYRDYLNRFRYFSDAQGLNIALRVHIPFTFQTIKKQ